MKDILEYKGYKGIVKSEESGSFSGEVIGIQKSLILFEGEDMDSLIQDFHKAVDDYLNMCKAHGREPEKPSRQFVRELLSVYLRNEMEYKDERENLKYKGYIGSVESQDDNTYYGKVLGIKALIAYEGASVEELIEDFHGAVDDYLSVCEAEGIEAETSCTETKKAFFGTKTILDRYNEIKDLPGITGGIDKLIIECFRYKVFKENPSERFKKDFEDRYEYPYPEYVSDITRKLARNLRIRTKYCRTQEMLALKKSQQRAKRGFSDIDVWSIDAWFLEVMPQMLKSFKKHQDGYPSRFLQSTNPKDEEEKAASEKWNGILDRMIFLLNEMDEDKCSMKNPYEKEKHRIDAQFRRKYGFFGEKAKSPSELEKEEVSGGRRMYFPSDFPDLYPTYDELYEKWSDSYDEICEYRNECRKEFFELFSEYFWDLWY